jgi:hypothetical protein
VIAGMASGARGWNKLQTFLTDATTDFAVTARKLDNKRLNKQALEAWQIMMTNLSLDPSGNHRVPRGWVSHPATKMWRGYEPVLLTYIRAMTDEWVARGYKTTIFDKAESTLRVAYENALNISEEYPEWMLCETLGKVAQTHRVALLCKNYEWYSQFEWEEDNGKAPESYEYIWA